jgi:NAD(P)-dependent dehydrogenase (short-subunit alcohol dehydrogenase family)
MSKDSKIIIVTGGTRGIGAAIVARFLAAGWDVILTGTNVETAKTSAIELARGMGPDSTVPVGMELDLTDQESIGRFVERLRLTMPDGVDALVNNAGICHFEPTTGCNKHLAEILAVNLEGPQLLTGLLLQTGLIHRGGGIVNISSQLGLVTRPGYAAYCASKAGLNALTKVWASEVGALGIRVNAVCPGWVDTGITDIDLGRLAREKGKDPVLFRRELEESLDLKRLQRPEEVAELVLFLVSSQSAGITGQVVPLSGPLM